MEDIYINEFHRIHSEALEKELEEQSKHPYTFEQAKRQVEEIKEASNSEMKKGRDDKKP